MDGMQYEEALETLETIPEISDALALVSLAQGSNAREIGLLLGIGTNMANRKIKNAKAVVREHAPESVRELICGPEEKSPYLASESIE